jgi:hypothetical protein
MRKFQVLRQKNLGLNRYGLFEVPKKLVEKPKEVGEVEKKDAQI